MNEINFTKGVRRKIKSLLKHEMLSGYKYYQVFKGIHLLNLFPFFKVSLILNQLEV